MRFSEQKFQRRAKRTKQAIRNVFLWVVEFKRREHAWHEFRKNGWNDTEEKEKFDSYVANANRYIKQHLQLLKREKEKLCR